VGLSTLIFAGEVKISVKVNFFSFYKTDDFLYDVTVSENHVLEERQCSGCVCVDNLEL